MSCVVAGPSSRSRVGVVFLPEDAAHAVDLVVRAEQAGVGTAWLEMNAIGLDPFPLLAAAAGRTERIGLGTAIVPAFSRHPVAMATQALSLEGLAPGRLRLGVGTGNTARMAQAFHQPTDRGLARLREYIRVLRPLLHEGRVRFAGEFYSADAELPEALAIPVLLSALGPQAYASAGELADGALSWLCPIDYVRDVAVPAMVEGASLADRATPPLIAHVAVALARADDPVGLREQVRHDLSLYARVPVFGRMFAAAGHPIVNGVVSDALLNDLVVIGDEDTVAIQVTKILDSGVDELMVSLIPDTHHPESEDTLLRALAAVESARRR